MGILSASLCKHLSAIHCKRLSKFKQHHHDVMVVMGLYVLLVQVHAENGEGVALGQQLVYDAGITGPEGHALSRPAVLEGEATTRAIKLASFVGVPLYVVHVMSKDALEEVGGLRLLPGQPVNSACREPQQRTDALQPDE
jgi:hypothetical protein